MQTRMPDSDDLHAAAHRHRERAAAIAAEAVPTAKELAVRRRKEQRMRRVMMRTALAEAGIRGKVASTVAICLGGFGPLVGGILVFGSDSILVVVGLVVLSMLCAFAMADLVELAMSALRRASLNRIGRGFDVQAYLDALGSKRRFGVVVVRVQFAKAWPDDASESVTDAVAEWMGESVKVAWNGDALELRSGELDGTEYLRGGQASPGSRVFDNRLFHGWFVRLVDDVVPRLEKVAPITALSVTIVGMVGAWDADAHRL